MFLEDLLTAFENFFIVIAWILTIGSAICGITGIIAFFTI